jgi:hypothetical protein
LTVYNEHHLFHANPLNRYSLGTKSKFMQHNPDGSLTLYFGTKSPGKEKETNWVPAPDGSLWAEQPLYMLNETVKSDQTNQTAFIPVFRYILLAVFAFAALPGPARAEGHHSEFVPELNVFIMLSDQIRLYLLGDITQGLSPHFTDGEVGVNLDLTLKPILRRDLRDGDWERNRYLWARVGYVVSGDLDGRDDRSNVRTFLVEATARIELPREALAGEPGTGGLP